MKAQTVGIQYGSGQGTDVGRTCMTWQRAQKEWAIKTSGGRVETEAAVKRSQCYLMFAHLTTLSPSLIHSSAGLIAVQPSNRACTLA